MNFESISISQEDHNFQRNYKLLIGSIVPRPIAWVSTRNKDGTSNLAPFSFFTAISANPMIVAFCPLIRSSTGEKKDTVINIEREKEFVVNFVPESLAQKCNLSSTELAYGEDEISFSDLNKLESLKVKAPRVKESPIHFECILRDTLNYGEHKGAGRLITGEVLQVHVRDDLYHEGKIIPEAYQAIGRGAGQQWIKTDSTLELDRLMKAQIQN